jgi:hypothetical protein
MIEEKIKCLTRCVFKVQDYFTFLFQDSEAAYPLRSLEINERTVDVFVRSFSIDILKFPRCALSKTLAS